MKFVGAALVLVFSAMAMACSDAVPTQATDETVVELTVAEKAPYEFWNVGYFNPYFFNNPETNPAWVGELTGPDGTVYTVLYMSIGSGKPFPDPFHAGMSHHFEELALVFTDVELNAEGAVVSGDPVLTVLHSGVVSPNEPLLQHFHATGSVVQGSGMFESWVGRKTTARGWLDIDPDTALPIHAWGPFIVH